MLNRQQAIGRLGNDAVVNNVNGRNVVNFNVAVSKKYKDAQGNFKETTDWFSCAYWSDKTAIAQYLKKGTLVYVEGEVAAKLYTPENKPPQAQLTLNVKMVQLLSSKPATPTLTQDGFVNETENNEQLPF